MARTRGERRHLREKAKRRAIWLRSHFGYDNIDPWWRFSDGWGKLEDAAWCNGKMRDGFEVGPNKIGRNGQHCKVERSTERSIIMRLEEEAA